jgi:phospholipid transport system transporter-binding protein
MKQRVMKGKKSSKSGSTRRAPAKAASRKSARTAASSVPKKGTAGQVALPAECLIATVDELRTYLSSQLTLESSVTIDAAAVQRIDTASLQLLAAFTRDRRDAGLSVEWAGVPAAMAEAATLLNLTHTLGLPA